VSAARPMAPEARDERRVEEIRRRLGCPFLSEEEAAAYLLVSRSTLSTKRVKGGGPLYRMHFGNIAYHIDDLDRWSETRKRRTTSDKPAAPAAAEEA
jgi:hypothetical protein